MLDFFAISLGAVAGANLRYWTSRYALRVLGPVFPYGTLVINVLGSFIVGFFVIWTTERVMAIRAGVCWWWSDSAAATRRFPVMHSRPCPTFKPDNGP